MKTYILAIAGTVLLSAVVTIIAPSGKMGKFINGSCKLLILVALLAPIGSWIAERSFPFQSREIETDSAYLQTCAELLSQRDEQEIKSYLEGEFGVLAHVDVVRASSGTFQREKVRAEIYDFGIIGRDEHIDTLSRIKGALEARYGCEAIIGEGTA